MALPQLPDHVCATGQSVSVLPVLSGQALPSSPLEEEEKEASEIRL